AWVLGLEPGTPAAAIDRAQPLRYPVALWRNLFVVVVNRKPRERGLMPDLRKVLRVNFDAYAPPVVRLRWALGINPLSQENLSLWTIAKDMRDGGVIPRAVSGHAHCCPDGDVAHLRAIYFDPFRS